MKENDGEDNSKKMKEAKNSSEKFQQFLISSVASAFDMPSYRLIFAAFLWNYEQNSASSGLVFVLFGSRQSSSFLLDVFFEFCVCFIDLELKNAVFSFVYR